MKKIYNVPATTVVALNVHQMLAASNPDVQFGDGKGNPEDFDTRKHQGVGGGLWSDMQ